MAELDPRQRHGAEITHSLVPNGNAQAIRGSAEALQLVEEAMNAALTRDVAIGFGEATKIRIVPERLDVIYDDSAIINAQQGQEGLTKAYVLRRGVDLSIFEFDPSRVEGRAALRPRPDSHSRITFYQEPWKDDRLNVADKAKMRGELRDAAIARDVQEALAEENDHFVNGSTPDGEVAIDTVIYTAQETMPCHAPLSDFVDWSTYEPVA